MTQILTLGQTDTIRTSLPAFGTEISPETRVVLSHYLDFFHFDKAMESVPATHQMGMLDIDSRRICVHYWKHPNARGTVFVVHGLFDHTGLFVGLIQALLEQGYSVICLDLPGHGLSEGPAAEIKSFNEYAQVIAQCSDYFQDKATQPFSIIGQSTGGAAVMKYLFNTQSTSAFAQATLLAPLIKASHWPLVATGYWLLKPFLHHVKREFQPSSHDTEFNHLIAHLDPMQCRHIPVCWIGAMVQWVKEFSNMPTLNCSLTVIQGTADETVDWRWNLGQILEHFPQTYIELIDGAKHHLPNEGPHWREQVFRHILESLPSGD